MIDLTKATTPEANPAPTATTESQIFIAPNQQLRDMLEAWLEGRISNGEYLLIITTEILRREVEEAECFASVIDAASRRSVATI